MKKTTISLLFIALIVCSSVLTSNLMTVNAQTGTNVSGVISTDTTWNSTGSPYTLTGNVLVNKGVNLSILAGTTVNLGTYYIMVNGTMQAVGNSTNPIVFNNGQIRLNGDSWNSITGSGTVIQYSNINCQLTIITSPKIDNNAITGIIDGNGNSIISNNTISGSISVSGGLIANNKITNVTSVHGAATVVGNIVSNVNGHALEVWGSATVSSNTIYSSSVGIWAYTQDQVCPCPLIQNNLIVNNSYGIEIVAWLIASTSSPIIKDNTISNNTCGIYLTPYNGLSVGQSLPVISGNNIFGNTLFDTQTTEGQDINATGNWWGTTSSQAIDQKISDYNDEFTLGRIIYSPIMSNANNNAPVYALAYSGSSGSIFPSGYVMANYGSNQIFTITANSGYHVADILVNGTSTGAGTSYTIQNITGATTISAIFAPDPTPTPTPTVTPTPKPTASPTPSPSSSQSPTATPTATPTQSPTSNPTTNPTQQPTTNPTQNVVTPTPTVPEYSALVIVPLLLSLLSIAMLLKYKKRA